jgi:hypothetical protein
VAIKRIWHGWTTLENADIYRKLLHDEVFPGIEAKNIPGYLSVELLRCDLADEVEFITIMTFQSLHVDLHLKLTQDLHLILTRPDRPIMA